ncbi:hypothetical protein PV350_04720 [Streptomyces sp. PA03-6a]|nr:hypothetical protein [Streptomyces sp. PA03-6a]
MQPWYATREDLKRSLGVKETAGANAAIDRALGASSRSIEGLLHRRFYPELATRSWDWPNGQGTAPWRLRLDSNELISVEQLLTGGQVIDAANYFLRRADNRDDPPYTMLELNLDSNAAFGGGPSTQRDIAVLGLYGYRNDETTAGTLAAGIGTTAANTITVDGPASAAVGVGSLLRIDTERVIVTERAQADTGLTLAANVDASMKTVLIPLSGPGVAAGETVLIDSEKMHVTDTVGNSLIVERQYDGLPLAAHTAGATVYAPRLLTVARGVLGTTAAVHSNGATVQRFDWPGPVNELCIAEAESALLQSRAGWARTITSGTGGGKAATLDALIDLREQVYTSHGRKGRVRVV